MEVSSQGLALRPLEDECCVALGTLGFLQAKSDASDLRAKIKERVILQIKAAEAQRLWKKTHVNTIYICKCTYPNC